MPAYPDVIASLESSIGPEASIRAKKAAEFELWSNVGLLGRDFAAPIGTLLSS